VNIENLLLIARDADTTRVAGQDLVPILPFDPGLELLHRPSRGGRVIGLRRQDRIDNIVAVTFLEQHRQASGNELEHLGLHFIADFDRLQFCSFFHGLAQVEVEIMFNEWLDRPDGGTP
jgi:hypothetical protein